MKLLLKRISEISMSLLLIISLFTVPVMAEDVIKTAKLTDITASITQGDSEINEDDDIDSSEKINVKVSFGVPLVGDGGEVGTYFEQNDVVSFIISDGFTLQSDITNKELKIPGSDGEDVVLGSVDITNDADGKLIATITFDGADEVFSGDYGNAIAKLDLNLKYDDSEDNGDIGDHDVYILEKKYTVNVPDDTDFTLGKSGTIVKENDGTYIDWTVKIDATNKDDYEISGYTFSDDLSDAGDYVENSFSWRYRS